MEWLNEYLGVIAVVSALLIYFGIGVAFLYGYRAWKSPAPRPNVKR